MHSESFGRIAQKSLFLYCDRSHTVKNTKTNLLEDISNLLKVDEMSIEIALKIFPVKYIFICTSYYSSPLCNELTNEILMEIFPLFKMKKCHQNV